MIELIIEIFIKISKNKNKIANKATIQKKTRLSKKRKKLQKLIAQNLKKRTNVQKLQTTLIKKFQINTQSLRFEIQTLKNRVLNFEQTTSIENDMIYFSFSTFDFKFAIFTIDSILTNDSNTKIDNDDFEDFDDIDEKNIIF